MRLSLKTQKTVYLAVGTAMIFFEIIKQLVLTFYVGKGQYQWFYFPFQLCSIPAIILYWMSIVSGAVLINTAEAYAKRIDNKRHIR